MAIAVTMLSLTASSALGAAHSVNARPASYASLAYVFAFLLPQGTGRQDICCRCGFACNADRVV